MRVQFRECIIIVIATLIIITPVSSDIVDDIVVDYHIGNEEVSRMRFWKDW